jgi:hypothetical protein
MPKTTRNLGLGLDITAKRPMFESSGSTAAHEE